MLTALVCIGVWLFFGILTYGFLKGKERDNIIERREHRYEILKHILKNWRETIENLQDPAMQQFYRRKLENNDDWNYAVDCLFADIEHREKEYQDSVYTSKQERSLWRYVILGPLGFAYIFAIFCLIAFLLAGDSDYDRALNQIKPRFCLRMPEGLCERKEK